MTVSCLSLYNLDKWRYKITQRSKECLLARKRINHKCTPAKILVVYNDSDLLKINLFSKFMRGQYEKLFVGKAS